LASKNILTQKGIIENRMEKFP